MRYATAALAAVLSVIAIVAVAGGFTNATPAQLEAARQAKADTAAAVASAESTLTAAKKADASAAASLKALEAESEPPKEEPPTGATVSATPLGPATPSSGWSVAYADGFGATIGTSAGQDNTWYPNAGGGVESSCKSITADCKGSNSNELQVFNGSQQAVTPEGLRLTCKLLPSAVTPVNSSESKHYRCGYVTGPYCCHTTVGEPAGYNAPLITVTPDLTVMSGYNAPLITVKSGVTYVFQCVMKLPRNTNEADPACWMSGPPYGGCCELDTPEVTAWNEGSGYGAHPIRFHWFPGGETSFAGPAGAETGFHTYTGALIPGQAGKHRLVAWVDGVKKYEGGEASDPTVSNRNPLILQYALRSTSLFPNGISTGFSTVGEERSTVIRSVAVYQDAAHAGGGVEHAGVAPGTTIR